MAFLDRPVFEETRSILAARNAVIDLCPPEAADESSATRALTIFLVDHAATLDLVGRIYNHAASLENRYFLLRQDFNALREVVNRLLESSAQRDPSLNALRDLHKGP